MKSLKIEIKLEYDEIIHGDDLESIAWFENLIEIPEKDQLILKSNNIGDTFNKVKRSKILLYK